MTFQFACRKLQRSKDLEPAGPAKLACPVRVPYTLMGSIFKKKEGITLITVYPDNHCLITRYPDNRYETRLTQPKRAAHPFDEIRLYICREPSTNQLLFLQNKPNFHDTQMNVSIFSKMDYEKFIPLAGQKNKPNSNPISPKGQNELKIACRKIWPHPHSHRQKEYLALWYKTVYPMRKNPPDLAMKKAGYLQWAIENTKTVWWHDSAEPSELERGIRRGAIGATTNPFLANLALSRNKDAWAKEIDNVLLEHLEPERKAEKLMSIAITHAAHQLEPQYEKSTGRMGYVCAQVNPARAAERECMLPMARRFHAWAPNIAVKLPATEAGLDVLEDCTAEGITATLTISYTVPQVIAIAERHRQGIRRAEQNSIEPGKCFAVIMIGRLDDYLRDVAHDCEADISESDIRQAGLAVSKRAYSIYKQRSYEATLIVAALRGTYHMTELAGAELIMSIAPPYQEMLLSEELPFEERIDHQIPGDVIERLSTLPEFVQAYEPEGMQPEDFITYGVTQKTLAQFHEGGWKLLENF